MPDPLGRAVVDLDDLEAALLKALEKVTIDKSYPQLRNHTHHYWRCKNCNSQHHGPSYNGFCNRTACKERTARHTLNLRKATSGIKAALSKAGPGKVSLDLVAAYTEAGLAEPFAVAIARDESNAGSVLDLWEADWWRQYEVTDPLIGAVLDGVLPEVDAKWLNTVRSDHPDLVTECIEQTLTVEWSKALLNAGFNGHVEAVKAVLQGGEPALVARIQRLKVEASALPPKRDGSLSKRSKKGTASSSIVPSESITENDLKVHVANKRLRDVREMWKLVHKLGMHGKNDQALAADLVKVGLLVHRDGGLRRQSVTSWKKTQLESAWTALGARKRGSWSTAEYRQNLKSVQNFFTIRS
jgi:hypothetical protein